jgi:propanol-preferring alcohol dehydrogenase
MVLKKLTEMAAQPEPLEGADLPVPVPGPGEILLRVLVCGVCHTELDEIEGRTPPPRLPVVPGHQVVGRVAKRGPGALSFAPGQRLGVAWIFSACGSCRHCQGGEENLCPSFRATGRDADGGYAEYMIVPEAFAHPIPEFFSDAEAAPLLCAGAVGYRSLRLCRLQDGEALGLTGFGASGHLVLSLARHLYPHSSLFVFARSEQERLFALELGASWAGDTEEAPPRPCRAIIDTTPVWRPVVRALECLEPGGRLVINAIRKERTDQDRLYELNYPEHLWMEKEVKSVANVTRADVRDFLTLAAAVPIRPEVQLYPLEEANRALRELKERKIRGAKVLQVDQRS